MKMYLGIDVSKGYADFVLLTEQLTRQEKTFQLDDTNKGHQCLKKWIAKLFKQHPGLELYCGVESTGGFENNWYHALNGISLTTALRVTRLNPSVVKNASKALLNANKTDAESAHDIASYLKRYEDQLDFSTQDNQYASFRSLSNHLDLMTRQKTQVINELKQLLYTSFPELQRYCKKSVPKWVLELLIAYPSPGKLSRAKASKVASLKGITLLKAEQLIEHAKDSVSSRNTITDEYLLVSMAKEILRKEDIIKDLKAHLGEKCHGTETELLETIKGIGAYSAAAIMIQIENIHRFESPKALASYFGLHPVLKMSGDHQWKSRMSKQGRSAIRSVLFMCANSAVLADTHLRAIYARHRANGKSHKAAIGIIMHKMIRIIWGILFNRKPYDPNVDQTNQAKNPSLPNQDELAEMTNKRRFQSFDQSAPISRIDTKKRKAHATSQVSKAELVRDPVHEPD